MEIHLVSHLSKSYTTKLYTKVKKTEISDSISGRKYMSKCYVNNSASRMSIGKVQELSAFGLYGFVALLSC